MEMQPRTIDLSPLAFTFTAKPLVIGGRAMEHYGLRRAGADIDLVITDADYQRLIRQYPGHRRDIWGDRGVCVHGFEIWRTIMLFNYDYLGYGAEDTGDVRMISLERLLLTRVWAMEIEKYRRDLDLVVKRMLQDAWPQRQRYLEGTVLSQFVRNAALVIVGEVAAAEVGGAAGQLVQAQQAWSLGNAVVAERLPGMTISIDVGSDALSVGPHLLLLKAGAGGRYAWFGSEATARISDGRLLHDAPDSPLGQCLHGRALTEVVRDIEQALVG